VTANGKVQGKTYEINGKAIANLLSSGDFEIDALQLAGNVMGTGTNFRWIGELRAVAEKGYGTTMTGLILRDAQAEMNEGVLTASANQFNASGMSASGAKVEGNVLGNQAAEQLAHFRNQFVEVKNLRLQNLHAAEGE